MRLANKALLHANPMQCEILEVVVVKITKRQLRRIIREQVKKYVDDSGILIVAIKKVLGPQPIWSESALKQLATALPKAGFDAEFGYEKGFSSAPVLIIRNVGPSRSNYSLNRRSHTSAPIAVVGNMGLERLA